jgi:hypothetical protein
MTDRIIGRFQAVYVDLLDVLGEATDSDTGKDHVWWDVETPYGPVHVYDGEHHHHTGPGCRRDPRKVKNGHGWMRYHASGFPAAVDHLVREVIHTGLTLTVDDGMAPDYRTYDFAAK